VLPDCPGSSIDAVEGMMWKMIVSLAPLLQAPPIEQIFEE